MTRLSVPTALLVLAFAAMAGPAAADGEDLRVGSLVVEGTAVQEGGLAMLFVLDIGAIQSVNQPATPWLSGSAGQVRTIEYVVTQKMVGVSHPGPAPIPKVVPGPQEELPPVENTFQSATFKLAAYQPGFEAHSFAVTGLVPYTATTDHREIEQIEQGHMGPGSMGAEPPLGVGGGLDSYDFAALQRDGPLVLHRGDPTQTEVVLRGDFVLEIKGLSVDIQGADAHKTIESGTWKTPLGADGQETAYERRDALVRMFFEDAEVTLAVDGGEPYIDWATSSLEMEPSGPVTFYDSYGRVAGHELQGSRYVLEPGSLLAIAPQSDGLRVGISEPELGPRGTIADVPAPASAALVGSGAVLALLVAIGLGLLRRVLRQPQLAEVENAIEEGEYRRAARLAGRILARRPDDESAILARGIALSKAGDQRRTVAELSDHLAHRPASDGSLHYVLGLAQLDLGEKDAGRASLREAVRLTPSLQAEVGSRLGKAFSSLGATTRETSGYA